MQASRTSPCLRPLAAAVLCCLAASAWTAPLQDPTRPPQAAAPAAAAPATAASSAAAARPAPLQLQAVHLPRLGTATALVDGRWLRVGDTLGRQTVAAIDAAGVLLRNPGGRAERLLLLQGLGMYPAGTVPQAATQAVYIGAPAATADAEALAPNPTVAAARRSNP